MSSQKIKQDIQTIQAWSQNNVILSGTHKEQFVQWCKDLTVKLEQACETPLKIGLMGGTGVGKSTIINRLAMAEISVAHNERPYTNKVVVYHYQKIEELYDLDHSHMIHIRHDRQEIKHLVLFDFPDYDSHLSEHQLMVKETARQLDIIVWVASPEKYADQSMIHMMSNLLQSSKNYCFVLNKTDQLQPDDIAQIIGHWHLLLRQANIIDVPIFSFSALNNDDVSFECFQQWLFHKRDAHELNAITHANIENQIKHRSQQIRQQVDCEKIYDIVEDLNKQMKLLDTFNNIRQKDILEIISPDALTDIHQYLSRQSRFVWPVGMAFGLIGRLKKLPVDRPAYRSSGNTCEFFLKTIDDAIAQIQNFPAVPESNMTVLQAYRQFIEQYKDPNQIAPLLGKIGFVRSIYFWIKQWVVLCIPFFLCLVYLSGMHQVSSINAIGLSTFLGGCFQIIIQLFQAEGLIAMMSLLFIEIFFCMQLASGWHKKLVRLSEELYKTLASHISQQLMLALHETIQPLNTWAEQARLDCENLNKII